MNQNQAPVNLVKSLRILWALSMLALWGCTSSGEIAPSENAPIARLPKTHFQLVKHKVIRNLYPLPDEIPIHIQWFEDDRLIRDIPSYRGWDFNHDGFIDMIEILSEDGLTQKRAFDFDFDGEIDAEH